MLTDNLEQYQRDHPEVPFHEVIDIIRPLADQEYLRAISTVAQEIPPNNEDSENKRTGTVEYIFLDRNNTPDIWPHISSSIESSCKVNFKSILILPK